MLRHRGLIAVCACIVASVGCTPTQPSPPAPVTVEFGGRVVNAVAGGPVANVRVSVSSLGSRGGSTPTDYSKHTATSGGDGTFTLPLPLSSDWTDVTLEFTGPAGYDHTWASFAPTAAAPCTISPCWAAADRPEIRMYPTLVIRPGESIEVRVDGIVECWWWGDGGPCRRVLVAASPGDPVELEVVPDDNSKPMALSLDGSFSGPDYMSVRRLMVPPGGLAYVIGPYIGTARLTARR
jgi:hypothetical protein